MIARSYLRRSLSRKPSHADAGSKAVLAVHKGFVHSCIGGSIIERRSRQSRVRTAMARRVIALCVTALYVQDCAAAQEKMPGAAMTEYLAKVDSSTGRDARATSLDSSGVTYADGVLQFARIGLDAVLGVTGDTSSHGGAKGSQPAPTSYLPTSVARSSGAVDVCGVSPLAAASEHSKAHWEFTDDANSMYAHATTDGSSQSCAAMRTFLADAGEGMPNRNETCVDVEPSDHITFFKRFYLSPPFISTILVVLIPSFLAGIAAALRRCHALLEPYTTMEIIQTPGEQVCRPAKLRRIGRIDNICVCAEDAGFLPQQV